jgi:long-chain acyl-CoA synthetase
MTFPGTATDRSATLDYPALRMDQLLARTAAAHPDRVAIRAGQRTTSYAELDAAVTRCAKRIRGLTGGERAVVAVGSLLDPDYVIAYYAAIRSGNIALPVVPLLPAVALKYTLEMSGAGIAFLSAQMNDRFGRIAGGLAAPPQVVVFGDGGLLASGSDDDDGELRDAAGYDPDEPAAMHFTSGTTGMPKAVVLSQRNVTANAAQVADALQIDAESVCVICFPTYHPMHMNGTVIAAATQVLTTDPDLTTAVRLANQTRATHMFSLPAWLNRLASHSGSDALGLDTVRFVGSGGAALNPVVAEQLRDRLGVPVIQGYGLAETSPLTHLDSPQDPVPGSVGRPVADTQCRIVGVESRAELAEGEAGEIQLRGPQVMLGYRHNPELAEIDADGWLSTGDVGYVDATGRLFLVDRIKDVFKHDNFMVSPTEIESVLAGHPAVADCVVVDRPHEVHGGVAYAYVALRGGPDQLDEIVGWVNDQLPYYKHIWDAEAVPSIPRSPNGKVPRRDLRGALHAQFAGGSKMVILLNRLTVTGDADKFEEVFAKSSQFMRAQPGFMGHTLVRSLRNPGSYVNIAHWEQAADHIQSVQNPEFMEHITALAEVSGSDPDLYSIVMEVERADD